MHPRSSKATVSLPLLVALWGLTAGCATEETKPGAQGDLQLGASQPATAYNEIAEAQEESDQPSQVGEPSAEPAQSAKEEPPAKNGAAPKVAEAATEPNKTGAEPSTPKPTPTHPAKVATATPSTNAKDGNQKRPAAEAMRQGQLMMLGAMGPAEAGTLADVFGNGKSTDGIGLGSIGTIGSGKLGTVGVAKPTANKQAAPTPEKKAATKTGTTEAAKK